MNLEYYIEKGLENLKITSRTAKGIVDLSASNAKGNSMQIGSGSDAADIATANFRKQLEHLFDNRSKQFNNPADLQQFVDGLAIEINKGIMKEGCLYRVHESDKYPYTSLEHIEYARDNFFNKLYLRINDMPNLPEVEKLKDWLTETAAWIEYRVNLTDHFYADGCGKVSAALVAFVCMRAKSRLPEISLTEQEKWQDILQVYGPKERRNFSEDDEDPQFHKWLDKYSEFFKHELHNKANLGTKFHP